jgi:hypothetical protein
MASMGFSTRAIIRETGLTSSQTTYRLKKAGIKRADYRNGESYMAKFQLRHATTDPELIRRTLKLRIIRLKIEVRGFQK